MRTWFSLLLLGSLVIAGTRHLELSDPVPPEVAERAGDKLVMYTTTHCPYCAEALKLSETLLARLGIEHAIGDAVLCEPRTRLGAIGTGGGGIHDEFVARARCDLGGHGIG